MPLLAYSCPGTRSTTAGRRRLPIVLRSAEGGSRFVSSFPYWIVARARGGSRSFRELEELGRCQARKVRPRAKASGGGTSLWPETLSSTYSAGGNLGVHQGKR
jgi:hypothetical protein